MADDSDWMDAIKKLGATFVKKTDTCDKWKHVFEDRE
jgi:hypothetical protein